MHVFEMTYSEKNMCHIAFKFDQNKEDSCCGRGYFHPDFTELLNCKFVHMTSLLACFFFSYSTYAPFICTQKQIIDITFAGQIA